MTSRTLVTALLISATALAGIYIVLFQLSQFFVVTFAAILLAIALDVPTSLLQRKLRLPRILALILVTLFLLAFWPALGGWIGPQISEQLPDLERQVRRGLENAREWFGTTEPFRSLRHLAPAPADVAPPISEVLLRTQRALVSGFGVVADVIIMVFVGFFLAANPARYSEGLLLLLPERERQSGRHLLAATGQALRWWLVARLFLMLFIGVLFGAGLWILDVPLKLPLAVLAGLFNFIPYIGPVLAYIPALAVSLLEGPRMALYVTILYVTIQLVESYLAEPLIEARTVTLAPALIVLAQVLCVVWLGFVGVLLATPLLIAAVVGIQVLYIQRVLGEDIRVTGQR